MDHKIKIIYEITSPILICMIENSTNNDEIFVYNYHVIKKNDIMLVLIPSFNVTIR